MKIKLTLLILFTLFLVSALPGITHAQTTIFGPKGSSLRDCMVGVKDATGNKWVIDPGSCTVEQIMDLANNIIQWIAAVSGALALLMYIIGGMWMLFSTGNPSRVQRGKDIITGTTIALIFILGSWLIIDFTVRALKGTPYGIDTTICTTEDSEGKWCGDNQVCYQNHCVSKCVRYHLQNLTYDWQCQNPKNCNPAMSYVDCASGNLEYCKTGLCPGGEDNVCCYNPYDIMY